jgi:lipoyl(octanoyl) transferase
MMPTVKQHGVVDYEPIWRAMQAWAAGEVSHDDELWFLQHAPVYTMGQNADPIHLLNPGDIPVINIDRGGQVTYHGPGQLVVYPLITLETYKLGIRSLVTLLEQSMVDTLAEFEITAAAKADAPGVYVDEKKIGSIGLRVKNGRCYHGLALNIDMDLEPFSRINPCGYDRLQMTDMRAQLTAVDFAEVSNALARNLIQALAERL